MKKNQNFKWFGCGLALVLAVTAGSVDALAKTKKSGSKKSKKLAAKFDSAADLNRYIQKFKVVFNPETLDISFLGNTSAACAKTLSAVLDPKQPILGIKSSDPSKCEGSKSAGQNVKLSSLGLKLKLSDAHAGKLKLGFVNDGEDNIGGSAVWDNVVDLPMVAQGDLLVSAPFAEKIASSEVNYSIRSAAQIEEARQAAYETLMIELSQKLSQQFYACVAEGNLPNAQESLSKIMQIASTGDPTVAQMREQLLEARLAQINQLTQIDDIPLDEKFLETVESRIRSLKTMSAGAFMMGDFKSALEYRKRVNEAADMLKNRVIERVAHLTQIGVMTASNEAAAQNVFDKLNRLGLSGQQDAMLKQVQFSYLTNRGVFYKSQMEQASEANNISAYEYSRRKLAAVVPQLTKSAVLQYQRSGCGGVNAKFQDDASKGEVTPASQLDNLARCDELYAVATGDGMGYLSTQQAKTMKALEQLRELNKTDPLVFDLSPKTTKASPATTTKEKETTEKAEDKTKGAPVSGVLVAGVPEELKSHPHIKQYCTQGDTYDVSQCGFWVKFLSAGQAIKNPQVSNKS